MSRKNASPSALKKIVVTSFQTSPAVSAAGVRTSQREEPRLDGAAREHEEEEGRDVDADEPRDDGRQPGAETDSCCSEEA